MTRLDLLRRRHISGGGTTDFGTSNMTTFTSTADVPTTSASKYLQQTCKHWAHNLEVSFTAEQGSIIFPKDARGANHPGDGVVTFSASHASLGVRIEASCEAQLEGLKGAVARHVDRFAFREAPLEYVWK